MQNDLQKLKLRGRLPDVPVADIPTSAYMPTPADTEALGSPCACPDDVDDEIIKGDPNALATELDVTKEEVEYAQRSMERLKQKREVQRRARPPAAATGSGSWPAGCYPNEYPEHHSALIYLERESIVSSKFRDLTTSEIDSFVGTNVWGDREEFMDRYGRLPMYDAVFALMIEACRRIGIALTPIDDGPDGSDHNMHVKGERIPGSTIGWGEFPNGTCGDHTLARIDNDFTAGAHSQCWLLLHEVGHMLGLEHEFQGQRNHRSIMSYSNVTPFVGFYDPRVMPQRSDRQADRSLPELKEFFGGEPVPVEGTDPGPDPEPQRHDIELTTNLAPGKYTLTAIDQGTDGGSDGGGDDGRVPVEH